MDFFVINLQIVIITYNFVVNTSIILILIINHLKFSFQFNIHIIIITSINYEIIITMATITNINFISSDFTNLV